MKPECWIYTGSTDRRGYPQLSHMVDGRKITTMIHRAMYETYVGTIPLGMTLDHLCRITTCINPEHLEPVTLLENQRRSPLQNISKSHCINGHDFNEENTQWQTRNGRMTRKCRTCSRKHINAWYAKKKMVA